MVIPSIRTAVPSDIVRLMQIERITFPPAEAASDDIFSYRIAHFGDWFFVAETDGVIAGCVICRRTDFERMDDSLYDADGESSGCCLAILSVETHPDHQNQGIASLLLSHALDRARESGLKYAYLCCKDHLIRFYEKNGFKNIGISGSTHAGVLWYDMRVKL